MENNEIMTGQPEPEEEIIVPIKFNKETRSLTLNEASLLAQKGLKFEAIEKDYGILRQLAAEEDKSVPCFVEALVQGRKADKKQALTEKCGGDETLAEHILELEGNAPKDLRLEEVSAHFPKIKKIEDLPQEVTDAASLKGTFLLDEYLRYLLKQKQSVKDTLQNQKAAEMAGTGSLMSQNNNQSPETEEFLRGLWQ